MTREQLDDALRALEHLCDGYCGTRQAPEDFLCNGCRVSAALIALTEWRPMDLAPRDGMLILVFFAGPLGGQIVVGWSKATGAWTDNLSSIRRSDLQFCGWLPLVPGPVGP